jgi:hypothetical protein
MAHDHAPHDHKADARAAFTGLISGAIALLAMVLIIVHFTNKKFASHETAAAPAHEASTPATGATPAATPQPQTKTPH